MFNKYQIVCKLINFNFLYLRNISTKKFDKCHKKIYKNNLPKLTQFNMNNMEKRNQETQEFANKLISQGHMCIEYLESYPIQIKWCGKNKCNHK